MTKVTKKVNDDGLLLGAIYNADTDSPEDLSILLEAAQTVMGELRITAIALDVRLEDRNRLSVSPLCVELWYEPDVFDELERE